MGSDPSQSIHIVTEVFTIVDSSTPTTAGRGEDGADPATGPALDSELFPAVKSLGKHAPYMVAFHQNDTIRTIGLCTAESARAVYDVVSREWAKVVVDRQRSEVLASFGSNHFVKLCQERISHMDAFNGNTPPQYAPFVVALHKNDRVKMIGFSKEGPARAVYNAISSEWAKILIDHTSDPQDLLSHGGHRWIRECKKEALLLPFFENPIPLSESGTYVVAFHQNDHVGMIGLSTEEAARTLYDGISMEWAKILIDKRRPGLLVSYGGAPYTEQCQNAIRGLDTLQSATLLTASYIIAFHQTNCVRMLGFSEERVARAMYSAISDEWAKVLMKKHDSKPLASYGYASYVRQCKEEVLRL